MSQFQFDNDFQQTAPQFTLSPEMLRRQQASAQRDINRRRRGQQVRGITDPVRRRAAAEASRAAQADTFGLGAIRNIPEAERTPAQFNLLTGQAQVEAVAPFLDRSQITPFERREQQLQQNLRFNPDVVLGREQIEARQGLQQAEIQGRRQRDIVQSSFALEQQRRQQQFESGQSAADRRVQVINKSISTFENLLNRSAGVLNEFSKNRLTKELERLKNERSKAEIEGRKEVAEIGAKSKETTARISAGGELGGEILSPSALLEKTKANKGTKANPLPLPENGKMIDGKFYRLDDGSVKMWKDK